jgi:peptidoglycan/xylan/chitin deacetylase (PgdA/CDA1 family)
MIASMLSGPVAGTRLSVLIYHRVPALADPLLPGEPDASVFSWQMAAVAKHFRVLRLGEAIERLRSGTLEPRSACITFDDGYADNATVALPILRRFGLQATFFVATGSIDGGRMWNDTIIEAVRVADAGTLDLRGVGLDAHALNGAESRRRAIDRLIAVLKYRTPQEREELVAAVQRAVNKALRHDLMMTSDQIRTLASAGMEIGAHTVSHRLLSKLTDHEARNEIETSRDVLRRITDREIRVFAYPNGRPGQDYGPRDVQIVRQLGFVGAVSTAWGVASPTSDPFQLPRFTPWDRTPMRFTARLLHNYLRRNPALA